MRMRKKAWAQPFLDAHPDYALVEPTRNKGKWKKILSCKFLHVEIGTGKGDYLNSMAKMYPEEGWIGIEKEHNVAAVACKKALQQEHLQKQCMIVGDGKDLLEWFASGEIDCIHLNFSDPWPKKSTHKRRLSSDLFLEMYAKVLSKDGTIRMKTDNAGLFEDSILTFVKHGYSFEEIHVDYRKNEHPEDAITEYEARFMALNQPIYQLVAKPGKHAETVSL